MKRILVDVDTQYDFMEPDGSLYVETDARTYGRIAGALADNSYDAVIGSVDSHAYDAWEFQENGGPFPPHCVKGTPGWLRTFANYPHKQRFIPMTHADSTVLVGERIQGQGFRTLNPKALAKEAIEGRVGLYFEKEVYSLFDNPFAAEVVAAVVEKLGVENVIFDVIGYCTGQDDNGNQFCVGAAALGLIERGYQVRVLSQATAPLANLDASITRLKAQGIKWH